MELSRDELVALHPYVINVPDGRLAAGASTSPTSVKDFKTVEADVDAIFSTHLPAFVAGHGGADVPLVIYAHGGLVPKASGLGIARKQVEWWKANGAFPVQFVWETALGDSLWDAVRDHIPGKARGFIADALDAIIEEVLRGARGRDTWGAMKRTAELASEPSGGARYFATRLGDYMAANPGTIRVHAVGHSAGSIFHAHLVPQLLAAGVPTIASLNLLAPAVRVDEFENRVLDPAVLARIEALTMFTMSEHFEKLDTCMGVYQKSLLYLIREALEPEEHAEILGLQESVRRNPRLREVFGSTTAGGKGTVMWSQTIGGGLRSSSRSEHHGDFDDDQDTMDSLGRRILDRDDLPRRFPAKGKTRDLGDPWLTTEEAFADIEARQTKLSQATSAQPVDGATRKALCIGIDAYPGKYALSGCVADAEAWAKELTSAGFEVSTLLNEQATLEEMVERIQGLVVGGKPGDVLVVQYSGHGTTVEDLNHDEYQEDGEGNQLAD
ncbi:MAG: caspase family protein, partial [Marmoricola sp.]